MQLPYLTVPPWRSLITFDYPEYSRIHVIDGVQAF